MVSELSYPYKTRENVLYAYRIQLMPSLTIDALHRRVGSSRHQKKCLPSIVGPCRNINSSTLSSFVLVQEVWPLCLCGNDYWPATAKQFMSLPRRDIVPVDPARNVAEKNPPSRPGEQFQSPQASMDGSQLVQRLSTQAGKMAGDLQHNVRTLMVRASSPRRDEVSSLRQQLRHQQQAHKKLQTTLRNQALAIETF